MDYNAVQLRPLEKAQVSLAQVNHGSSLVGAAVQGLTEEQLEYLRAISSSQEAQSSEALAENVEQAADVVTSESEEAKKEQELEAKAAIVAQAKAANEAAIEDAPAKPAAGD